MRYRSRPGDHSSMRPVRLQNLPFRLSWRLRRWAAIAGHAAPWIAGGLERPDRQQRYSRSVDVRGWVSAPADRPVAVDVRLGDSQLQRLALTPAPGAPAPARPRPLDVRRGDPARARAVAGRGCGSSRRRGGLACRRSRVLGIMRTGARPAWRQAAAACRLRRGLGRGRDDALGRCSSRSPAPPIRRRWPRAAAAPPTTWRARPAIRATRYRARDRLRRRPASAPACAPAAVARWIGADVLGARCCGHAAQPRWPDSAQRVARAR